MKNMNHGEYQKQVKTQSTKSLVYTIQDCKEAIAAWPSSDNAGYYADEIHYCAAELKRRGYYNN